MYAQLVNTDAKKVKSLAEMEPQERAFQERIDAGIKAEPKDWLPEAGIMTGIRHTF
jgi:ring-1,2-phenylacetyl-CoA epoxidase subunit PaaA